jgi:very-short-patch-repair endonuclease
MRPGARELAVVLACGVEAAWIRRRSALSLLGAIPPWHGDVEVVVVGRHVRSRNGIAVHRMAALPDDYKATHHGIPIVAPALALLEFAAVAVDDELERAIAEAYALKLVTEAKLRAVLAQRPRVPGVVELRAELDRAGGPQWDRSKAERRMRQLLREARLTQPAMGQRVAGWPADFLWREERLILEVDSYQFHGHPYAFERDRRRDQAHITAGYTVIRVTWRQMKEEPLRVIAVIALALGAARGAA